MNIPGIRVMLLSGCVGVVVFGLLVFAGIVCAAYDPARSPYDTEVVLAMAAAIAIAFSPAGAVIGGITAAFTARRGLIWSAVLGAGLGFACGGLLAIYVASRQNYLDATPVAVVPYLLGGMTAIGVVTAAAARLAAARVRRG